MTHAHAAVEKPLRQKAPSNLVIMGRYVLTPDIFDRIDETEHRVGGEIQLTDAFKNWIQFTESHLKEKPMTLETGWSGLRPRLNLPWRTMSSGMIWWSI